MKVRVFQNPDGSVRVVHPNAKLRQPGESDDAFIARIAEDAQTKDSTLAGLPFIDVDRDTLPGNRQVRHKWRVNGQNLGVDPTVPDRPNPRQGLINRANNANSVAELRQIILDLLKG